eukprot:12377716-Alexandrium_andersonii.AAC.1
MQSSRSCDPQTARAHQSEGATKPERRSAGARAHAPREGCKADTEGAPPGTTRGQCAAGHARARRRRPRRSWRAPWPS